MLNRQPTLQGPRLRLRPLQTHDFDALYAVAADPLLWEQHPAHKRHERPEFERFFAEGLASGGAQAGRCARGGVDQTRWHAV